MGNKLFSIMEDRVPRIAATIEANAMCVFATLKKVVGYLAFTFVSVLKTYNNVCNQVSSMFLDLYQYLNIGSELTQVKNAAHSPWQLNRCSNLPPKSGKFGSKKFLTIMAFFFFIYSP
tara:strand:- start:3752 stop:4105 length:354 start_codon:yes stop_codon:yes gene_type:complete